MFQLWSQKNKEAKEMLSPTLGLRDWGKLSWEEKDKLWHYLPEWFLGPDIRVLFTVLRLNELHKFRAYAAKTLRHLSEDTAQADFRTIFYEQDTHVVLELLSCFCSVILDERKNTQGKIWQASDESDEEWQHRLAEWRHEKFDKFASRLNDVFEAFGVNVVLTRSWFIERQDPKIVNEIYIPVLNFLSLPRWEAAERDLRDAFKEYRQKTKEGYSNCITHAVSGLEAFLQILIDGKTGSSAGLTALITQAKGKGLLPQDEFSGKVLRGIGETLMRERGKTGDGHPKEEYANEKSARLVLNLVMVFMQHCI